MCSRDIRLKVITFNWPYRAPAHVLVKQKAYHCWCNIVHTIYGALYCCVFTTRCSDPARCLDATPSRRRATGAPLTTFDQIYTGRMSGGRVRMSAGLLGSVGLLQGGSVGPRRPECPAVLFLYRCESRVHHRRGPLQSDAAADRVTLRTLCICRGSCR